MEVGFEQTERTDRAPWKEDFCMNIWKDLHGKLIYEAK